MKLIQPLRRGSRWNRSASVEGGRGEVDPVPLERIRCVDRKDVDCYAVDEVGGEADPSVARAAGERIRWVDSQHDQGYAVEEYAGGEADLVL